MVLLGLYGPQNRTDVVDNGIPVPVGLVYDDLAAGNLSSFAALPMDPYGNPAAFVVVTALMYEGFRCVVDYLGVHDPAVPAPAPSWLLVRIS